jgi:hypothetical protein
MIKAPSPVFKDPELEVAFQRSVERFKALSPVDKAIHRIEQRNSFVRGNLGIDHPEWTEEKLAAIGEDDPAFVLMVEVLRLREEVRRLEKLLEIVRDVY